MGPFALSGHMVQNYTSLEASCTMGLSKLLPFSSSCTVRWLIPILETDEWAEVGVLAVSLGETELCLLL